MLYARRKQWGLDGVEVDVRHQRARDTGTDRIEVTLNLGGDLSPEQVTALRSVSQRCPVHRMLVGGVEIVEQ